MGGRLGERMATVLLKIRDLVRNAEFAATKEERILKGIRFFNY
jgi:hypothetical protein